MRFQEGKHVLHRGTVDEATGYVVLEHRLALAHVVKAILHRSQGNAAIDRNRLQHHVDPVAVLVRKTSANAVEIGLAILAFVDLIGDVARTLV